MCWSLMRKKTRERLQDDGDDDDAEGPIFNVKILCFILPPDELMDSC